MEQKINPELKPQVEFPQSGEHVETNLPEQGVQPSESQNEKEVQDPSGSAETSVDESSVVTETLAPEAQPTLSEQELEEEIKEDLIHKSLDEISSANEAVEALMNKETPADNLNALM